MSSSILKPVRTAIARILADDLELDGFAYTPATPTPGSVFVRPTPGVEYLDYRDGTFDNPRARLSAVLVGGVVAWEDALDWLEGKIEDSRRAFAANPTVDGLVDYAWVATVAEPGLIPSAGAEGLLAARFDLGPLEVLAMEAT